MEGFLAIIGLIFLIFISFALGIAFCYFFIAPSTKRAKTKRITALLEKLGRLFCN